jgi:ABC-type thiamine transport system substrate-binding protein
VPAAFDKFSKVTVPAANVSAKDIAANRDKWIDAWTQAVLR